MARDKNIGGLKTPIWLVISTDELRPQICHAYFKDGKVIATDAHVLTVQDLKEVHNLKDEEIKHLDGKLIHWKVLKFIEKFDVVRFESNGIHCSGEIKCVIPYCSNDRDMKFPNAWKIIDDFNSDEKSEIGINPILLDKLHKAMGRPISGVKLEFNEAKKYIAVRHAEYHKHEMLSLIMPVETNSYV